MGGSAKNFPCMERWNHMTPNSKGVTRLPKACIAGYRDVHQRQWVSTATAVLTEQEWPFHPFPLQLLLAAVAVAVN